MKFCSSLINDDSIFTIHLKHTDIIELVIKKAYATTTHHINATVFKNRCRPFFDAALYLLIIELAFCCDIVDVSNLKAIWSTAVHFHFSFRPCTHTHTHTLRVLVYTCAQICKKGALLKTQCFHILSNNFWLLLSQWTFSTKHCSIII